MIILAHPKPRFEENSYVGRWSNALRAQGADVQFLSFANAVKHRDAVVHIHWPEHLVSHPHWAGRILKTLNALAILGVLAILRRPVIWTAHNEQPHSDVHRGLQGAVSSAVRRLTTSIIVTTQAHQELLEECYPELQDVPFHVIPLGSLALEGALTAQIGHQQQEVAACPAFIQFGTIDPYKEQLKTLDHLEQQISDNQVTLTFVGRIGDKAYADQLRSRVEELPGVDLIDRYVSDEELATLIMAADASLALQAGAINSGVIPASVPLGTPVVSAETDQAQEHRQALGDTWIYCAKPPLTNEAWRKIVCWARQDRPEAPTEYFDWQINAQKHLAVYESG